VSRFVVLFDVKVEEQTVCGPRHFAARLELPIDAETPDGAAKKVADALRVVLADPRPLPPGRTGVLQPVREGVP